MNKKVFINILIGREEEKLNISKEEWKELEEEFERIKPVLDRLGKKETTHEDWEKFIKLIEDNCHKELKKEIEKLKYDIINLKDQIKAEKHRVR